MTKMFYSTPLPEAKHEAAEKSDIAALHQHAVDAMKIINKKKYKVIDVRQMSEDEKDEITRKIRGIPQTAYELLQLLDDQQGPKMSEKEKIVPGIFPAEEYEVHSELFTEEEEKIFQEQCRIIKRNIFGDFDPSKASCMMRTEDFINRQRTYAEEI